MKKILFLLLICVYHVSAKLPALNASVKLPKLNIQKEINQDLNNNNKSHPLRYATVAMVEGVFIKDNQSQGGQWNRLSNDSWAWRLKITAKNALSLDVSLENVFLPPTAEVRLYDKLQNLAKGPFTELDNTKFKQLWPGPVIGEEVTLELRVSDRYKKYVSLALKKVFRGFRPIWKEVDVISKSDKQGFWDSIDAPFFKNSGACNIDVSCNDADEWQDQVDSVARYTFEKEGSLFTCTGQLINNSNNDGRPLFLTAYHCGTSNNSSSSLWENIAPTINIWWNYQSNQCRAPNTSSSSTPISINNFNDTQSGARVLAQYAPSDMVLLELNQMPDSSYNAYYSGWDRTDKAVSSAVTIHHPNFGAKRISFENNPLSITGYAINSSGDRTHLRVNDWDKGTTESGSSGAGLWSEEKLLIGQLHGGYAACGNDEPDWFGRLFTSWNGGGSASSGLKEWLDPINANALKLQGLSTNQCQSLSASIIHQTNQETIDENQNFSASISGGTAPFHYQWDIDGDEIIDGTEAQISVQYSSQYINNIYLKVTDADGCTINATKAVVIEAPQISIKSIGAKQQLCGNDDGYVDPGERWRVPIVLKNQGSLTAHNSYAALSKNDLSIFQSIGHDDYGNNIGTCHSEFIDISITGTELNIEDADIYDDFSPQDEGSAKITITNTFDFYGQNINHLSLSTNGYISIDTNDSGADFDNDCPLPTHPNHTVNGSSDLARIIPFHDDLITQHIYFQYYSSCPRAAEYSADLSCYVFMYKDVDLFDENNAVIEHFDFESILYPQTSQWAFQYQGIDLNASSASIGIQNTKGTDGISYSCNDEAKINSQNAVCIIHKDQVQYESSSDYLYLETPVLSLGTMQASQQKTMFVDYGIDPQAQCGDPVTVQMEAAVYESGFNQEGSNIISTTLGNNGICRVATNCQTSKENTISPISGLWDNSHRSGNGMDMYYIGDNDTTNSLVYIHYTALEDHSPIWYITGSNQSMQNNQSTNELLLVSYDGPFLTSTGTNVKIGQSTTTLINETQAIQTRTINNKFSAELIEPLNFGTRPLEQRTGIWFNPNQNGWGLSIGTKSSRQVVISYLYDDVGQPYWLIGADESSAENIDMSYYTTFCPHCPKLLAQGNTVGAIQIEFDESNTTGKIKQLDVDFISDKHSGQWNRTNLPIQLITPVQD